MVLVLLLMSDLCRYAPCSIHFRPYDNVNMTNGWCRQLGLTLVALSQVDDDEEEDEDENVAKHSVQL